MIIFDYKKRDFKEIKINNNKKYFIKSGKKFIEVPIEVYRLYKADYMKTYRLLKRKQGLSQITYEEDFMLNSIINMDRYYIEQINKKELIHSLSKAIKLLNDEQYFIIYSIFFKDETEASVARKLNISQQALNWKKKKILLFFKNHLLNSSNSNES